MSDESDRFLAQATTYLDQLHAKAIDVSKGETATVSVVEMVTLVEFAAIGVLATMARLPAARADLATLRHELRARLTSAGAPDHRASLELAAFLVRDHLRGYDCFEPEGA